MACSTNKTSIDIIITSRFTKAEEMNGIIDFSISKWLRVLVEICEKN